MSREQTVALCVGAKENFPSYTKLLLAGFRFDELRFQRVQQTPYFRGLGWNMHVCSTEIDATAVTELGNRRIGAGFISNPISAHVLRSFVLGRFVFKSPYNNNAFNHRLYEFKLRW